MVLAPGRGLSPVMSSHAVIAMDGPANTINDVTIRAGVLSFLVKRNTTTPAARNTKYRKITVRYA